VGQLQHFRIAGTGIYLPSEVVSAEQVDSRMSAPVGWTASRSQVLTRYECLPPESVATMAGKACRAALQDAGRSIAEIDLIIDCSTSLYQPIPCNAAVYQSQLGPDAAGIPCVDVHGTCLGFVLALNMVNGLFATGAYRRVLLIASEAALAGVNWNEWESASLMSDGAAAVIVEACEPSESFVYRHQTFSEYRDACEVRSGGHRQGPFEYSPEHEADFRFSMNGAALFRVARQKLPGMVNEVFKATSVQRNEVHIVPHQASPFAVESIRRIIDHPESLYHNRVARLGNMVAASIPVVLHQVIQEGNVTRGDTLMLLGTSAGYAQAACTFRY
jgi:3-oxoacyl-[acyl-carrier-protein] synthase III